MAIATFLFGITIFIATAFISERIKGPYLESKYLHPLFFFGFLTFLISGDFFMLKHTLEINGGHYFSQYLISGTGNFNYAASCFILMTMAALVGYLLGTEKPLLFPVIGPFLAHQAQKNRKRFVQTVSFPTALFLVAFAVLLLPPMLIEFAKGGLLRVASFRSVFIGQNPLYALIISCMAPAFFVLCSGPFTRRTLFVLFFILAFVYIIIGSRGAVVMVLLGFVASSFADRKINPALLLISFFALLMLGYYYTYLTRYSWKYDTLYAFWVVEGNPFTFIMNSPELSVADSMMLHLDESIIDRNWYDSLLGAAFAYIPRSIIPWKPEGISAEMTAAIDYERWLLVQSEWTVSGYLNAIYEMGLIGGLVFNVLLFFLFGAWDAGARRSPGLRIFVTCIQIYLMLGYIRGDIYNMGLRMWSIIVVVILVKIGMTVLRIRFRSSPNVTRLS